MIIKEDIMRDNPVIELSSSFGTFPVIETPNCVVTVTNESRVITVIRIKKILFNISLFYS